MPTSLLPTLAKLVTRRLSVQQIEQEAWPDLVHLASVHKLAPLLYRYLNINNGAEIIPPQAWKRLLAIFGETAANSLLSQKEIVAWGNRFAEAGIKAVWLKGAVLAYTVYPDPAMRPMTDIDVLVPMNEAQQALDLVTAVTGQEAATLPLEQSVHAVFNVGPAGLIKMELHWSLIDIPGSQLVPDLTWFLSQTQPFELQGQELWTLKPEAHLLYLCAHAQLGHSESDMQICRYLDIHNLLQVTALFDWQIVVEKAVEFGWTYAVERAMIWTQGFFATDIPDWVLPQLRDQRPVHENMRIVTQQNTNFTRWQRMSTRLQALEGQQRWRFALAQVFPPTSYMRWRYGWAGWKLPLAYPYRWFIALRAIGKTALGKRDSRT